MGRLGALMGVEKVCVLQKSGGVGGGGGSTERAVGTRPEGRLEKTERPWDLSAMAK